MRFKQRVEVVDMTSSPSYSPSLSLSPAYIAPGVRLSPSSPPKYSYPFVDLTSPYSPSDDSCLPPLPPLPPFPHPSPGLPCYELSNISPTSPMLFLTAQLVEHHMANMDTEQDTSLMFVKPAAPPALSLLFRGVSKNP
jgi:hypothetical protein